MRRTLAIVSVLVLAASSAVFAVQVTLQYFNAKSNGTSISLEWKSTVEQDIAEYQIERAGQDNQFRFVATIQAKGSNQAYSYRDDEAFGKRDGTDGSTASSFFTYRLRIIQADRSSTYSNTVGVTHNVSGIKRTWGMIKEMFR